MRNTMTDTTTNTALALLREIYDGLKQGALPNPGDPWWAAASAAITAPAQSGEYPADTGNPEADRIIGRLASSDPDFDDCADAAALIFKLVAEHKCPDGYATWKDAAVAERLRRLAAEAQSESEPPPLPRHEWLLNSSPAMPGYTAEQMRTYRAARGAAQAAPADAAVQQDAERMDWLAEQYIGPDFRWGDPVTEVVVIEMPKGGSYCGDFRADIDAARAAQGGA